MAFRETHIFWSNLGYLVTIFHSLTKDNMWSAPDMNFCQVSDTVSGKLTFVSVICGLCRSQFTKKIPVEFNQIRTRNYNRHFLLPDKQFLIKNRHLDVRHSIGHNFPLQHINENCLGCI